MRESPARGAAQRAGSVDNAPWAKASSATGLHEVETQLPLLRNETVIAFAVLPDGLATWVYDDRGVSSRWSRGATGLLQARAQRFRGLCSDPHSNLADIRTQERMLYDALLAPIEQQISSGRVLVVEADDPLAGIPFDALMDGHGQYLSERGPIVSSLGIYYRRDGIASASVSPESTALVVAVPATDAVDDVSVTPLANATSEGEMVARNFRSAQLLSAGEATARAVVSGLGSVAVFHFAGHALNSPSRSGLLVADSLLGADALRTVHFKNMRLAVLSACDTEGGSASGGYNSESLVRAFLSRGVPNVVASRWTVDSSATQEFMSLFYQGLLGGKGTAEAIRQAQSEMRSRPGLSHPYYWSAFSTFGIS